MHNCRRKIKSIFLLLYLLICILCHVWWNTFFFFYSGFELCTTNFDSTELLCIFKVQYIKFDEILQQYDIFTWNKNQNEN